MMGLDRLQPAEVAHHLPGRLRIKLPHARGQAAFLERIKESLSPREGVRWVRVNAMTGSVVIAYDPGLLERFQEELALHSRDAGLFHLQLNPGAKESRTAYFLDDFLGGISESVKHLSHEVIDLKEIFPLAIGAYALLFVDRAVGAPLWLSLMFFSFSSYMDLHEPEPDEAADEMAALRAEIAALRDDIQALAKTKRRSLKTQ